MKAFNLRNWLRKTPIPVAVMADDKRVEVPKHGRSWPELARTIVALGPSKLTALDGSGNVLRSTVLSDDDDDDKKDSGVTDIQLFAKLLAEAYAKGANYAPLLDNAMDFIERQGARLAQQERVIEGLRLQNTKLQAEILALTAAPEPEGEGGQLLAAVLQGHAQGQADAAAKAAAKNGKAIAK